MAFADLCAVQAYFLELLLPVLVRHLLGLLQDLRLKLQRVGELLLEIVRELLLLIPIDVHLLEMVHDRRVLTLAEIEDASLLLVDACHHPSLVADIVVDFLGPVTDA